MPIGMRLGWVEELLAFMLSSSDTRVSIVGLGGV